MSAASHEIGDPRGDSRTTLGACLASLLLCDATRSAQKELIVVFEMENPVATPFGEFVNNAELSEFGEGAIGRGLADAKPCGEGAKAGTFNIERSTLNFQREPPWKLNVQS